MADRFRTGVDRARWAVFGAVLATAALAGGTFAMGQVNDGNDNDIHSAVISSGSKDVFVPLTPTRVMDTRSGLGGVTSAPLGPGGKVTLTINGVAGVPADASAVTLNVTVAGTTQGSYLAVYPTSSGANPAPVVSNLNWEAGQVVANAVTVRVGLGGQISFYNDSGSTHVIADIAGYYVNHNHDDRYVTPAIRVRSDGTLVSKTITNTVTTTRVNTGRYRVAIPGIDLTQCAATVTPATFDTSEGTFDLSGQVYYTAGNTSSVNVTFSHEATAGPFVTDTDFSIVFYCS